MAAATERLLTILLDHSSQGIRRRDELIASLQAERAQLRAERDELKATNARLNRELNGQLEEAWQAECQREGKWG